MENQTIPEKIDVFSLLRRFSKHLKRLWVLVLALAVALGSVNYLRARRSYVPMYEAKATFSVISGYAEDDVFSSSYYYDNTAAKELAAAFPHLLSTDMMRDLMMEYLGKSYINGSITANSVADTNLFELRVRSSSAQDAYDILGAVIECYPQVAMIMVENPQVLVRQEPTLPTAPYNPFDGSSSALSGAVMGALLGLGIVLLAAWMNKTITSPTELKQAVNLPTLAALPHVLEKARKQGSRQAAFLKAAQDPGLAEAFRGLRTRLHKMLDEAGSKVILVTSTLPGEGKSTISLNLAIALAAEGHKVALLDADLRNPSIGRMLGAKTPKGLAECLDDPRQGVIPCLRKCSQPGLYYLSGPEMRKQHYTINSKAIGRILEELRPHFDYIILDSAPCGIVSDTALLGQSADALLYVIKQDHATQNQILDAITMLYNRDIPLTGCILNDVPRRQLADYGRGYGYGYGKKYGK